MSKKKITRVKESIYKFILKINSQEFKSEADTIIDGLKLLKTQLPFLIKGKVILTVTDGKKNYNKMLTVYQVKRLVNNKFYPQFFAKNVALFMK